jgi:hypothetical protein
VPAVALLMRRSYRIDTAPIKIDTV